MARSQKKKSSAARREAPRSPSRPDGSPSRPGRPEPTARSERLVTRRDMAGWVGGTPREGLRGRWPGDLLGLAESGPTSMAGWGRRVLALVIDWFLAALVSAAWFQGHSLVTLGLFALMHVLLVGLIGTTIGKRLAGIRVVRVGGAMAGLPRALLRTVLLCLIVPPLMMDADGRGLHDRVAGTVQIRM